MLAKALFWIALLTLIAVAAFTLGCGGSSSSSTTSCTGTYDVVGDWNLTLNGTSGEGGVIDTTGLALFFDSLGDVVAFPTLTGACSFTGTATVYETALGGGTTGTASVTGNVTSTIAISGTASNSSGSAPFSAAPATPLTGSVTAVSGPMDAEIYDEANADIWQVTVTPTGTNNDMTFTGPNAGDTCTISGSFTQEGTSSDNLNVFSVTLTFSGSTCLYTTLTGLGFEGSTDYFYGTTTGPYLYAIASNAPVVLELFPPTGDKAAQHHQQAKPGYRFSFN